MQEAAGKGVCYALHRGTSEVYANVKRLREVCATKPGVTRVSSAVHTT